MSDSIVVKAGLGFAIGLGAVWLSGKALRKRQPVRKTAENESVERQSSGPKRDSHLLQKFKFLSVAMSEIVAQLDLDCVISRGCFRHFLLFNFIFRLDSAMKISKASGAAIFMFRAVSFITVAFE